MYVRVALVALLPAFAAAADQKLPLPAAMLADGWVALFDGKSTFGWKVSDGVTVTMRPAARRRLASAGCAPRIGQSLGRHQRGSRAARNSEGEGRLASTMLRPSAGSWFI